MFSILYKELKKFKIYKILIIYIYIFCDKIKHMKIIFLVFFFSELFRLLSIMAGWLLHVLDVGLEGGKLCLGDYPSLVILFFLMAKSH